MRFHKNMALLALEQSAGMAALYAAYFVGLYFPRWLNITLAVLLGACAFIGCLVCSEKGREDGLFLFPVIFSLAAGLSVAAYFCRVGNNFFGNYPILLFCLGAILLNGAFLFADWGNGKAFIVQNVLSSLVGLCVLAFAVYCFCNWNASSHALMFREGAFAMLFLFIVMAGEGLYLWTGGDFRHKMNLSFCAAFFVVLFVVLLIITEGDAADALDGFVPEGVGKNKLNKYR
ncbi:hypothetical protein ESZ91_02620 [Candidatus Borkfalkia ceftriaxoniphila]|uniref:Uncharacterized protein n=1 Tax=Candidatus Borkfalkia ceftriaxoniphila TaxID=2508949 RepID=A0A4Q2K9H0_9FIRM|nr:hypothetical protein [Candidatus Borkfalkia ceftriaxoniphila]RXZ61298.1 hypothetical protein ESZ91_02620 [Candidatus Borkfalkia ceftriaxoniphila]